MTTRAMLAARPQVYRVGATYALSLILLHAIAGCGAKPVNSTSTLAAQDAASSQTYPVTYDERLSPKRLTPAQIKQIVGEAQRIAPAELRIWFILVHSNYLSEGKSHWNATVFYTPDSATARIRIGKRLYLRSEFLEFDASTVQSSATRPAGESPLEEYAQVSLQTEPFGNNLKVPPPRLWPFHKPEGFADEEIVELVDFARTSPVKEETTTQPDGDVATRIVALEFFSQEPILSIKKLEDGVVEVWSGAQQDWLAGSGTIMRCVKKDGRWVVLEIELWVS